MTTTSQAICRGCGVSLSVIQRVRGLCDNPECRRKDVSYQTQLKHQALLVSIRQRLPESWRPLPIAVLPHNDLALTKLGSERIEAFRAFLADTVRQARTQSAPAVETSAPTNGITDDQAELPALDAACGLCGGHCCYTGGNSAWLEAATIQRWLGTDIAVSEQRIVDHYLSYLPEFSYEHSCVYHAAQGCSLPRKLRSNVCNQFLCRGLSEMLNGLSAKSEHCVVASVNGSTVKSVALFDALGILQTNRV